MKKSEDKIANFTLNDADGKTYLGILRTTFILDENDRVVKVFEKVKPDGHTEEVLEALG